MAQRLKHLPAMRETQVRFLGWEDPLEKDMATHSSTLAWRIPWKEEPGRLQSMGLQRVRHDWVTNYYYPLIIQYALDFWVITKNLFLVTWSFQQTGFGQAEFQQFSLLSAEALILLSLKHTRPFPGLLFSLPFLWPSSRVGGPYPSHLSSNGIFSKKSLMTTRMSSDDPTTLCGAKL